MNSAIKFISDTRNSIPFSHHRFYDLPLSKTELATAVACTAIAAGAAFLFPPAALSPAASAAAAAILSLYTSCGVLKYFSLEKKWKEAVPVDAQNAYVDLKNFIFASSNPRHAISLIPNLDLNKKQRLLTTLHSILTSSHKDKILFFDLILNMQNSNATYFSAYLIEEQRTSVPGIVTIDSVLRKHFSLVQSFSESRWLAQYKAIAKNESDLLNPIWQNFRTFFTHGNEKNNLDLFNQYVAVAIAAQEAIVQSEEKDLDHVLSLLKYFGANIFTNGKYLITPEIIRDIQKNGGSLPSVSGSEQHMNRIATALIPFHKDGFYYNAKKDSYTQIPPSFNKSSSQIRNAIILAYSPRQKMQEEINALLQHFDSLQK